MDAPSLPPLTRQYPQWSRTGMLRLTNPKEFTNRIRVKKPTAEVFSSGVAGASGTGTGVPGALDAVRRVGQLEQNIRFLQEQHALLLTGLHREIEAQRQMNRDLQFQLVYSNKKPTDNTPEASTSTKSEDSKPSKSIIAPPPPEPSVDTASTSLNDEDRERFERLEQELLAAKAALQTTLARTADLQAQLQQYKNQEALTLKESSSRRIASSWSLGGSGGELPGSGSGIVGAPDAGEEDAPALRARLADAERLVGGLRAAGERQRREVLRPRPVGERGVTNLLFEPAPAAPVATNYLQSIKASLNAAGRGNAGGGGGGGRGGAGGRGGQQRFPPLQPPQHQAYWQQREPLKNANNVTEKPSNKSVPSKTNAIGFGRTLAKTSPKTSPRNNVSVKVLSTEHGGSWTRSQRRGGEKGELHNGAPPALPDLRTSNAPVYNNGNSNNSNQGQSRRGGGSHGYSNHYFRNSDRSHRNGESRSTDEEQQQQKTFNTPVDLSDGEVEPPVEGNSKGHHRNKRGHHRQQQDKS